MLSCLQVSISKTKLKVGLKGADPVLDGELFASVMPEDCYWNISDGKVVELNLQKVGLIAATSCHQYTETSISFAGHTKA